MFNLNMQDLIVFVLVWPRNVLDNVKVLAHTQFEMVKLNCKINSTNGGTFSKSAGKFFWVFFLVQGA